MINQKETVNLRQKQKEAREGLVFRHGGSRAVLHHGEFKQVRGKQQDERTLLAKRIHEFRQIQERERTLFALSLTVLGTINLKIGAGILIAPEPDHLKGLHVPVSVSLNSKKIHIVDACN